MLEHNSPNHLNDNYIILDEDTKTVVLRDLVSAMDHLKSLHREISIDNCTVSARYNLLSILRMSVQKITKLLGGQEDLDQDEERQLNLLRAANGEIRRLQAELGLGVTNEAVAQKMHALERIIYSWWKDLGFLTCEVTFSPGFDTANVKVDFSLSIDKDISLFEEKPVTKKAEIEETLKKLYKDIDIEYQDRYTQYVIDSDKNRNRLKELIYAKFPRSRISQFSGYNYDDKPSVIRRIMVNIPIVSVQ